MLEKRSRLQSDIDDFGRQSTVYLSSVAISRPPRTSNIEEWPDLDNLDVECDLPQASAATLDISQMDESLPAELRPLPLPSVLTDDIISSNPALLLAASSEFALREGQANDALHDLRMAIAYKSYLYRKNFRNNTPTQAYVTRSYGEVRAAETSIEQAAKTYRLARKVMMKLKPLDALTAKYPALTKDDLRASTAIADSNAPGQRSDNLSWIWGTPLVVADGSRPASLDECKLDQLRHVDPPLLLAPQFIVSIGYERKHVVIAGLRRKIS